MLESLEGKKKGKYGYKMSVLKRQGTQSQSRPAIFNLKEINKRVILYYTYIEREIVRKRERE